MKKIMFIIAALALFSGFTSCQKDKFAEQAGIYNPAMKISRISRQEAGGPREVILLFKWDGDKLVEVSDPNDNWFLLNYIYASNRLSKVDYPPENFILRECYYDGTNYSKWVERDDPDEGSETDFYYTDGKISSIHYYDDYEIADLSWIGDNVSTVTVRERDSDITNYTYYYDNHNNPFYGSFGYYCEILCEETSLSKNNVTNIVRTFTRSYGSGYRITYDLSYQYNDGGFPIQQTIVEKREDFDMNGNVLHSNTDTITYYYEYL